MMIGFEQKVAFFDRQAVLSVIGKAKTKNLSKAGSYVRRSARSSLRRRRASSLPGEPPSVHTKHPVATLKNIWFVFDRQSRSVIVGPVKLRTSSLTSSNRATVPELMEKGGTAVVVKSKVRRRARYEPRPFMGPALKRELPKFEGLWAKSIR